MKALSIQQPWAWLITKATKDIENRDWSTDYRGLILIHAPKSFDKNFFSEDGALYLPYAVQVCGSSIACVMPECLGDYIGEKRDRSGIVGYATLKDVVTKSDSPWFRGKYGLVLTQRHTVPFIPLRGQPCLFDVSAEIEAEINAIRDERAWAEDAKDMEQIKREWRDYRLEGDESPPTPPSQMK